MIPGEQLKGDHAACSHSGLFEESRAFIVESEKPNDAPDTTTNVLPVVGALVPIATSLVSTESQLNALFKDEDLLDMETAAMDDVPPAKTAGLLQVADEELAQIDAGQELLPSRFLAV